MKAGLEHHSPTLSTACGSLLGHLANPLLFTGRPAGRLGLISRAARSEGADVLAALSEHAPACEFAALPRPSDERPARA